MSVQKLCRTSQPKSLSHDTMVQSFKPASPYMPPAHSIHTSCVHHCCLVLPLHVRLPLKVATPLLLQADGIRTLRGHRYRLALQLSVPLVHKHMAVAATPSCRSTPAFDAWYTHTSRTRLPIRLSSAVSSQTHHNIEFGPASFTLFTIWGGRNRTYISDYFYGLPP
jgi:hypothetical protein